METARRSRRDLLIGLAGLVGVAAGWQVWIGRSRGFTFEPIEGLPEWRRATVEGVSLGGGASGAIFLGIDEDKTEEPPLPAGALCRTLYRAAGPGVPVAVFTDFYCPNCRRFDPMVTALSEELGLAVTWHEWPLFGRLSEIAARAAIAAELQGGFGAMQARLLTTPFRPSETFLRELADDIGLDGARLVRDMRGAQVETRLRETRRAAQTLGLLGTPAITVGRTVVNGVLSASELSELVAQSEGC